MASYRHEWKPSALKELRKPGNDAIGRSLNLVLERALVLLLAATAGLAAVWLWPRHIPRLWFPAALLASVMAGVVIHELGHILVGFAVRFQPVLIVAGPVRFRRMTGGWRVDFGRLGFIGGAAVSVPTDERRLIRRIAVFIAGGAAANLSSMMAAIAVVFSSGETLTGTVATVFAFVSALMVWLALYPAAMAGVRTDGSRLLMLRERGAEAERWVASFWIIGLSFLGHRPRSWPEDWVRKATGYEDISPDDFQSAMILYARALDNGDLTEARSSLARAARSLHVTALISKPEYHIEAAFLAAIDGDLHRADAHLSAVQGNLIRRASLERARAAREWAAGNREGAARHARAGIEAAADDWDMGMTELDLHWLNCFTQSAIT